MALILEGGENEAHKEVSKKRGQKVYEFARPNTFRRGIDITEIAEILNHSDVTESANRRIY